MRFDRRQEAGGCRMSDHIRIRKAEGIWTIRAGGAVLGETSEARELSEGGYPVVIYFPRGDVAMAFLDRTETLTSCPWKGKATHYSIVTQNTTIRDAVWSYEDPVPEAARIKGYLAFYRDRVTVEQN